MLDDDVSGIVDWLIQDPLMKKYSLSSAKATELLTQALDSKDILHVVSLKESKQSLGFSWCIPNGTFCKGPYLRLLMVEQANSGKGLGTMLLDRLEMDLTESSRHLTLLCADFNTQAQRFYEKHGYKHVGSLKDFVLPGTTELVYYKQLVDNKLD